LKTLRISMVALGMALVLSSMIRAQNQQDNASQSILTYKDYAAIPHNVPYILEFRSGKGELLLYGSDHTGSFDNPEIADIQARWTGFKPTVAYNEGGNPPTLEDVHEAVKDYDEPGLLRYLAGRDQVPVATFEPPFDDEVNFLRKSYTPQQIKVFYALRQVTEARNEDIGESIDKFIQEWLSGYLPAHGLKNAPNNLAEFTDACHSLFPQLADWHKVSEDWFDPTQQLQFTNKMVGDAAMFRDQRIFSTLVNRVKRGDRVFVVVGEAHVVVQEPALVREFGKPVMKLNGLPAK
jgi:hypothetical protein